MLLSGADKNFLLKVARETVTRVVGGQQPLDYEPVSEVTAQHRGAFVTLRKWGQLRGCIGLIEGLRPLVATVRDMAVAAASILARGEFVLRLKKLSEEFEVKLPLGNKKDLVIAAGKSVVKKAGMDALVRVGKIHFKTVIFEANCRGGKNFKNCVKCHPLMTRQYFEEYRRERRKITSDSGDAGTKTRSADRSTDDGTNPVTSAGGAARAFSTSADEAAYDAPTRSRSGTEG
jgi:hypothetical protein